MACELDFTTVLPDWGGRCVTEFMPGLGGRVSNAVVTEEAAAADTAVLLVVDGLGWHQLRRHGACAPTLAGHLDDEPLSTVVPSTTTAALTSVTTGVPPGGHGFVSYLTLTQAGRMNGLRWKARKQSALTRVVPEQFQPIPPFAGAEAAVVSRAKFARTGFTRAHLRTGAFRGYARTADLPETVAAACAEGFRLVYAYIDDLDVMGHMTGLGGRYLDVLAQINAVVLRLVERLPANAVLLVTGDHGLVNVTSPVCVLPPEITDLCVDWSGEARFLWLHAHDGAADELADACGRYRAWGPVVTRAQAVDDGWFGPRVTDAARSRLGDVALVAVQPIAYGMPDDPHKPSHRLIGRHGGLSAEEMQVPLVTLWGRRRP